MDSSADSIVTDLLVLPTARLDSATRAAIVALCTRAFAKDFASLFYYVELSMTPMHVVAYRDDALIAHACWSTRALQPEGYEPLRTANVDAVATDPAYQGRGVGSLIIRRVISETASFSLCALSTQRVSFYARLGWERWVGPVAVRTPSGIVRTPGETVMILRTATTPPLDTSGLLIADERAGQPW